MAREQKYYISRGFGIACFIHNPEYIEIPIPDKSRTHLALVFDTIEEAEAAILEDAEDWYNDQDEKEYSYAIIPTIRVKRNYGYSTGK